MALSHAILAVLNDCPCSGYDLAKRFDGSVGFFWNATHQQIYRELTKLEAQHQIDALIVHQEHRPDKKVYTLTAKGEELLRTWIETPTTVSPLKDELLVKIFAGAIVSPQIIVAQLKHHQAQHQASLNTYQSIAQKYFADRSQLSEVGRYHYITLRQGIGFETEWLRWCQESIDLLELEESILVESNSSVGTD